MMRLQILGDPNLMRELERVRPHNSQPCLEVQLTELSHSRPNRN